MSKKEFINWLQAFLSSIGPSGITHPQWELLKAKLDLVEKKSKNLYVQTEGWVILTTWE